jgi:hypothetical protein
MPIPVINYSAQQPEGYPLGKQLIPAIASGFELGYLPNNLSEDLKRKQLANQLAQLKIDYEPRINEADLLQKYLSNSLDKVKLDFAPQNAEQFLRQQQLANELGSIKNMYAPQEHELDIETSKQDIQYLPLKHQLETDRIRAQNERFGDAYKLRTLFQSLPSDQKKVLIANNPDLFNDVVLGQLNNVSDQLYNQTYQGKNPAQISNQDISQYQLSLTPEQEDNLVKAGIATRGATINRPSITDPSGSEALRKSAEMSATKDLSSGALLKQREAVDQLDEFFDNNEFNRKVKNASVYAGAPGAIKLGIDRMLRNTPQSLIDYDSLKNFDMVFALNRIKSADAMGSTDSQREELHDIWAKGIDSFYSTPSQFITQMENMKGSVKRLGDAVKKSYDKLGYEAKNEKRNAESQKRVVKVDPTTWMEQ